MSVFLQNVLITLKRGVALGGFPEGLYKILSKPERIVAVSIPVRLDNGELEVFEGFRVQHCSALGPYKGGIRFYPGVTLEDDIALATLMTLKNSLAGLPYGGGKGAVRVDPRKLSARELEQLARGYVRALYPVLGELVDIPAPDVGTDSRVMAWMVDEYSKLLGRNAPASFTAKPAVLWGNPVREYATGFGCAVMTREAAERILGNFKGLALAVQGFGNTGQWHAYWASKMGFKVVAISDLSGTVYDPDGIDIEKAMKVKSETGKVVNYPGGEKLSDTKAAFYVDADVIAPDAVENQITLENVGKVKAKARGGGRKRTYDSRGGARVGEARRGCCARLPRERGRRGHELPRVGSEPPVVLVERGGDQGEARENHVRQLRESLGEIRGDEEELARGRDAGRRTRHRAPEDLRRDEGERLAVARKPLHCER
jgi:glutamate dehydrogenase/leucine dehydrogenase